jgi:hypothetical protein
MRSDIRIRNIYHPYLLRPTVFYPRYTSGYDYVSYVSPVESVAFQKVLPRYRLSSSQTRDTGLGPFFEKIAYPSRAEKVKDEAAPGKHPGEKYYPSRKKYFKGYVTAWHVDVLA